MSLFDAVNIQNGIFFCFLVTTSHPDGIVGMRKKTAAKKRTGHVNKYRTGK